MTDTDYHCLQSIIRLFELVFSLVFHAKDNDMSVRFGCIIVCSCVQWRFATEITSKMFFTLRPKLDRNLIMAKSNTYVACCTRIANDKSQISVALTPKLV